MGSEQIPLHGEFVRRLRTVLSTEQGTCTHASSRYHGSSPSSTEHDHKTCLLMAWVLRLEFSQLQNPASDTQGKDSPCPAPRTLVR